MKVSEVRNLNDAWILHREEIETLQDGICDVYVILDAISGYCFAMETSKDLPSPSKLAALLEQSFTKAKTKPKSIFILKSDPLVEEISLICKELKIPFNTALKKELTPFINDFLVAFRELKTGQQEPTQITEDDLVSQEEVEAFIPETYGPCPCGSGKKYKFCCQKAFKDITFAMCDAQDDRLDKALFYMGQAESKIGLTPEILCRYAICWSFFDRVKSDEYLSKAIAENPNHPRSNYILGLNSVEDEDYDAAIIYYKKAIEHYPQVLSLPYLATPEFCHIWQLYM